MIRIFIAQPKREACEELWLERRVWIDPSKSYYDVDSSDFRRLSNKEYFSIGIVYIENKPKVSSGSCGLNSKFFTPDPFEKYDILDSEGLEFSAPNKSIQPSKPFVYHESELMRHTRYFKGCTMTDAQCESYRAKIDAQTSLARTIGLLACIAFLNRLKLDVEPSKDLPERVSRRPRTTMRSGTRGSSRKGDTWGRMSRSVLRASRSIKLKA